jgi:hypothetical protein
VVLGRQPELVDNDVVARAFAVLDRAQIEFDRKERIYDLARSQQPLALRLSALQALGVPRALETAIGEIFTANPDR